MTTITESVALRLWDVGAVKVNVDSPFTLASGKQSPIYINCRTAIGYPLFVDWFCRCSTQKLLNASIGQFNVVAGGVTAGVPYASFLARDWKNPLAYVRQASKNHGIKELVEGQCNKGDVLLLVEDLITDGFSKIGFIDAIRNRGGIVKDVLVVLDRLQGGRELLKQRNIELHSLTTIEDVMTVGKRNMRRSDYENVMNYLGITIK